jgi:hypothetical protein
MPFTADVLAAATAAGCAQIVELPCGNYVAGFNADPATPVPQTLTSFQFKAALAQLGYYTAVLAYINGTAPLVDQMAWAECTQYNRTDAIIASIATAMGYTSEQVDSVFIAGFAITP